MRCSGMPCGDCSREGEEWLEEKRKASVRAKVEHVPGRRCNLSDAKVRYRGLFKKDAAARVAGAGQHGSSGATCCVTRESAPRIPCTRSRFVPHSWLTRGSRSVKMPTRDGMATRGERDGRTRCTTTRRSERSGFWNDSIGWFPPLEQRIAPHYPMPGRGRLMLRVHIGNWSTTSATRRWRTRCTRISPCSASWGSTRSPMRPPPAGGGRAGEGVARGDQPPSGGGRTAVETGDCG